MLTERATTCALMCCTPIKYPDKRNVFECFIASVAEKVAKIEYVENYEKLKILFKISLYMICNRFYFCEFFNYISNHVIKKYLFRQNNGLVDITWMRADLRAL